MPDVIAITTQLVPIDLPAPIAPQGGTLVFRRLDNIVVHVETDSGVRGSAYVWLPGSGRGPTIEPPAVATNVASMVHAFAPHVLGGDVAEHERLWRRMLVLAEHHGRGVTSLAHSAIDMAMWDAWCKTIGVPLYRMLGTPATPVRYYSNELLDLWDADVATLVDAACRLAEGGYRDLKIPGGLHPLRGVEWDIERVAAVRSAVGPDVGIMLDVGCRWPADDVLPAARQLDELGLRWLEDPVPLTQVDRLRDLRSRIRTPIATGENSFNILELVSLARSDALDIIIFEPMRIGGITGIQKLGALTEVTGTPIAPHTYPDLAAQVLPGSPTGSVGEYLSWWRESLEHPIEVVGGHGAASPRPGIGLDFLPNVLDGQPQQRTALQ